MLKLLKKSERGNAMVEFAVLLPIYLLLLLGAYFLGEACLLRHQVRHSARVMAEVGGGWPYATYVREVMQDNLYAFSMNNYESTDLTIGDPGGGLMNYRDNQQLRDTLSWAIQNGADTNGVGDDIANVLVGNLYYDPVEAEWRGGVVTNLIATESAPTKMIFESSQGGTGSAGEAGPQSFLPESGQLETLTPRPGAASPDVYYDYFTVRATYMTAHGGGPNFAIPGDTGPFSHPIEIVAENFSDNGGYYGRMPQPQYQILIPSDSVFGPRYFPFSWQRQQQQRGGTTGGGPTP